MQYCKNIGLLNPTQWDTTVDMDGTNDLVQDWGNWLTWDCGISSVLAMEFISLVNTLEIPQSQVKPPKWK